MTTSVKISSKEFKKRSKIFEHCVERQQEQRGKRM